MLRSAYIRPSSFFFIFLSSLVFSVAAISLLFVHERRAISAEAAPVFVYFFVVSLLQLRYFPLG